MSIARPALFSRLESARSVLIAGAGGGFDVFAGLPIGLALAAQGKRVSYANLSFTYLGGTSTPWLAPHVGVVTADCTGGDDYFPERVLARFLRSQALADVVYTFEKVGVVPLRERAEPDAIELVDGGTDILMFGDEAGLGTPREDMTSLCAVAGLQVAERLVACIGFGIDSFHGVCHAHFLENVAQLERDGAYLGAFSVPRSSAEGAAFLKAVAEAQAATPGRPSIVNGSIAAAIAGEFGNVQFTRRTSESELFINPLMGLYFTFDLPGLARRSLYLERLEETQTIFDVSLQIEAFRNGIRTRPRRVIPH
jgi:hypothetical protein